MNTSACEQPAARRTAKQHQPGRGRGGRHSAHNREVAAGTARLLQIVRTLMWRLDAQSGWSAAA